MGYYMSTEERLREGMPCSHNGCLSHLSHPCEGCGRIGGRYMTTQQQLIDKCTPEIIKKMCELAEGFEIFYDEETDGFVDPFDNEYYIEDGLNKVESFPLLIHRAVEGWNNNNRQGVRIQSVNDMIIRYIDDIIIRYEFKDYQPTTLTRAECALLDCLIDILKG